MATTDKYDRQLRLWGPHGQRALMNAKICLVNADAAGTETLKNLVLPGVGSFTIIDDKVIGTDDLECNFFVTSDSVGKLRGKVVKDLLCELNPDVIGESISASISSPDICNIEFLKRFSLIIVANVIESSMRNIASLCWLHQIPFINVTTNGLLATCRLQLKDHHIIESKPDEGESRKPDLRIAQPFTHLEKYANSIDLESLENHDFVHVPYVVILFKLLQKWISNHNEGKFPSTWAEKSAFKDYVKETGAKMKNQRGLKSHDGENWSEAVNFSYLAYYMGELPWEAASVLERLDVNNFRPNSEFEVLLIALKRFQGTMQGTLPLAGTIPDLTASTVFFQGLQQAYMVKATDDRKHFTRCVTEVINEYSLHDTASNPLISEEKIDLFCKNVRNIRSLTTRSIEEEYTKPATDALLEALWEPEVAEQPNQHPILWYLALRGAARHASLTGDTTFEDVDQLWENIKQVASEYHHGEEGKLGDGLEGVLTRDFAVELHRYGGGELHNLAAIIGGVVSQEAVKIITNQYLPLNNTFIYNGIASIGYRLEA